MVSHPWRCRNRWHRRKVCNKNRFWLRLRLRLRLWLRLIERIFRDEDFSYRGKEMGNLCFSGDGGDKEVGFGKEFRDIAAREDSAGKRVANRVGVVTDT